MPAKGDLVCVTGASGFIALHLIKQLLEKGARVPPARIDIDHYRSLVTAALLRF
jgi:UDP-glucose 4-epimerase